MQKQIKIKTVQKAIIYKVFQYKDGRRIRATITETTSKKDNNKSYHVSCGLAYNVKTFEEAKAIVEKILTNYYAGLGHQVIFNYES